MAEKEGNLEAVLKEAVDLVYMPLLLLFFPPRILVGKREKEKLAPF